MPEIPQDVLSERFQAHMKGRRLVSAIFTTFRFEAGFFETEILPAFFDQTLSHSEDVRRAQLEDVLRLLPGTIAVYYDQNGIVAEGGPAKLDIKRYPVRHPTGIFHTKNVLALVEDAEPDEDGGRARRLLVSCASANLTRAGWWRNVEVAAIEEIEHGAKTVLRDDLIDFVDRLVAAVEGKRANDDTRREHGAAAEIREFLRATETREHRSSSGKLNTHFHAGRESVASVLDRVTGGALRGLNLEIISPYFDDEQFSAPLDDIIDRFNPAEVRLFLPRDNAGEALCSAPLYDSVRKKGIANWARFPSGLTRITKDDENSRFTHAKVYRFFDPKRGGREILYVGSANLTRAGCGVDGKAANWESGFVCERTTGVRPDWWLEIDGKRPTEFEPRSEDEGAAASGGSPLAVRFNWTSKRAEVWWNENTLSPPLELAAQGVPLCVIGTVPPREWQRLSDENASLIERALRSTSLLEVHAMDREPGLILIQEEGMGTKPSLALELSAADILRYWSLLSAEQRAAFLEARIATFGADDPVAMKLAPLPQHTTMFDRFAGIFHAFECLEQRALASIESGKRRDADYLLFGRKHDSLATLLTRVMKQFDAGEDDRIEQYVTLLCARQLLSSVARHHPDYLAEHTGERKELEAQLEGSGRIRSRISESGSDLVEFLNWFEPLFLRRAERYSPEALP